jgi:hypothetical protein
VGSLKLQLVAATLGFLLCQRVFFVDVIDTSSLLVTQWTYLGIAFTIVFLGLFFYYIPLPEPTDSDLQSQAERRGIDSSQKYFGRFPDRYNTRSPAPKHAPHQNTRFTPKHLLLLT